MKNIFLFTVLVSLFAFEVNAQQLPKSSLYNANPFHINSAYAGLNGGTELYLSHRAQWTGIQSAPKTLFFSWHSALPKNIGLGANIAYDKTDIISRFSGALTYSYRIKFAEDHSLGFGLSAGLHQIRITPGNAIVADQTDDIYTSGNQSGIAFNNEFSILYHVKNFNFGIAVPQIIESTVNYDLLSTDGSFGFKRHFIGHGSYNLKLGEKFSMQPSVVYKTFDFKEHQVDINTQLTYNDFIYLGIGYRTKSMIIGRFGMNVKDLFQVAYAYEATTKNVGSYSNGSHEIMLGITLKGKNTKEPIDCEFETEIPIPVEKKEEIVKEIIEEVAPEEEVKETQKEENPDLKVFELHVDFPLAGTDVNQDFHSELNKIANEMKNYPELNIIVVGHSCDLGSEAVKEKIALERAEIVKSYLIKQGVNAANLSVEGKADKEPLVPNISEENRKKNRRVEFVVVGKE